jgi:hypothetical protein
MRHQDAKLGQLPRLNKNIDSLPNHLIFDNVDGTLSIHLDEFVGKLGRLFDCHFESFSHCLCRLCYGVYFH